MPTAPAHPRGARFDERMLTPRAPKPLDATSHLEAFAIVTYDVEPRALARLLPSGFVPETRRLDDARERAFVSAVSFRNVGFHFRFAPFVRASMGQINYRAYVLLRGAGGALERAVWFFGTGLASPWVLWPRLGWKLPWHATRYRIALSPGPQGGRRGTRYEVAARGELTSASVSLEDTGEPMGRLDGFVDEEDTAVVLTHPLEGYYLRTDGALGTYGIFHDRLALTRARVRQASYRLFERAGLIGPRSVPHSALVMPETDFTIHLPPRLA